MDIRSKVAAAMAFHMVMWLAMLSLFAGLIGCAAAVYLAVAAVLPEALAALFAGLSLIGVFLILALVVGAAVRPSHRNKRAEHQPRVDNAVEQNLRPVIGDRATNWTKDHTGMAIVGALAAGTILTASPSLRHFLVRAAGPIVTRKAIRAVQDFTD